MTRGVDGPPPRLARMVRPRASGAPGLQAVHANIIACEACPRLRAYCQRIGREKRRAFRQDTYWARPVPGFGDPGARVLGIGLAPAAHAPNPTAPPSTAHRAR